MAKHYIYKGERPSDGARNLQQSLEATMLRAEGSTYRGKANSTMINWGVTTEEAQRLYDLSPNGFNNPRQVAVAVNKRAFFRHMAAHAPGLTVPYVENYDEALALVQNGARIFARTILNGHSGKGIHLMVSSADQDREAIRKVREHTTFPVSVYNMLTGEVTNAEPLVRTQLFTQGILGRRTEFRVHVFRGRAILTQVKLRREGAMELPAYNSVVRNLDSGWVYGVNNVPDLGRIESETAAIRALATLQLDFGAVDVVYKGDTAQAFVLEVNTAPGLGDDGSSLRAYTEAFQNV